MIAASLAGSGTLPKHIKKLSEPVSQFLFRLPVDALPAVLLAQLGGYLAGAKSAQSLYSNGIISKSQANRMMHFCINAGMGFSVNAVGNAMLCSREAGKTLLISLCISSMITGVISRFFCCDNISETKKIHRSVVPFSSAIVESVNSASRAMLVACGFVTLFAGIGTVADCCIGHEKARIAVSCLLEVTKGCADITGKASLPVIASVCAFGGLCVHLQIFSLMQDSGINYLQFYVFRIIHSASAYAVCRLILHFRPIENEVFLSFSQNAEVFSFSAPAAISLLFLCFLLILDLDNSRKIC